MEQIPYAGFSWSHNRVGEIEKKSLQRLKMTIHKNYSKNFSRTSNDWQFKLIISSFQDFFPQCFPTQLFILIFDVSESKPQEENNETHSSKKSTESSRLNSQKSFGSFNSEFESNSNPIQRSKLVSPVRTNFVYVSPASTGLPS